MNFTYMDKVREQRAKEKREKLAVILNGILGFAVVVAIIFIVGYEPNM